MHLVILSYICTKSLFLNISLINPNIIFIGINNQSVFTNYIYRNKNNTNYLQKKNNCYFLCLKNIIIVSSSLNE